MKTMDYSNLAVFGSIGSIVLLAGVAILMKWISSQVATRKHADSLTPADLRVLETSAASLVEEIKETASVACRDLDDRCEDLRKLILLADQKISLWAQLTADTEHPQPAVRPIEHRLPEHTGEMDTQSRVYHLADSGLSSTDIAREMEIPVGEVTLMLSCRPTARV